MTDTGRAADRGSTDGGNDTVQSTYDWSETAPSTGVIETVAAAADREPMEMEPLYETIDPDALDALTRSGAGGTSVQFIFAGHDVTVHSNGTVAVRPM